MNLLLSKCLDLDFLMSFCGDMFSSTRAKFALKTVEVGTFILNNLFIKSTRVR